MQTSIPSDINETYMALFQEVCHLHRKWGVFRHLYVSGQEIVDLINDAGGDFFGLTQTLLAHDIVLTIARLTDPKQSAGRENLCLEQLIHSIDFSQHGQLRRNIEQIYSQSKPKFTFAKTYRNKLIAHYDFAMKLARLPEPPIPTTKKRSVTYGTILPIIIWRLLSIRTTSCSLWTLLFRLRFIGH